MPGRHAAGQQDRAYPGTPRLDPLVTVHGPRTDASLAMARLAPRTQDRDDIGRIRDFPCRGRHPAVPSDRTAAGAGGARIAGDGPALEVGADRLRQLVTFGLGVAPGRCAVDDSPALGIDEDRLAAARDVEGPGDELAVVTEHRDIGRKPRRLASERLAVVAGARVDRQEDDVRPGQAALRFLEE